MHKIICVLMIFTSSAAHAQTVYKCTNANGSAVYSSTPCGNESANFCVDSNGNPKPGACAKKHPTYTDEDNGSNPPVPAPPPKKDTAIQAISDGVADSNCRRAAQRLEISPSTSEIDSLKAQVYQLEHSSYVNARTGAVTASSQIMEQEDRTRAASLRGVIATKEQQNAEINLESQRAARAALDKCDTEKAVRDKAREQ